MSVFSDRLIESRKEKGYSQEKLAEEVDMSRDTVSQWENDKRVPKLSELIKICDALECDADYLLGRIDKDTNAMQIICNETGLTENSVNQFKGALHLKKNLQEDLVNDFINDGKAEKEIERKDFFYGYDLINIVNRLLCDYPGFFESIGEVFWTHDNLSMYKEKNPDQKDAYPDEDINSFERSDAFSCMEMALDLFGFISKGEKHYSFNHDAEKFASDFIYDQLKYYEMRVVDNTDEINDSPDFDNDIHDEE